MRRVAKPKSKPCSHCNHRAQPRVVNGGCRGPRAGLNICLPAASAQLAPHPLARALWALRGFFPLDVWYPPGEMLLMALCHVLGSELTWTWSLALWLLVCELLEVLYSWASPRTWPPVLCCFGLHIGFYPDISLPDLSVADAVFKGW